MNEKILNILLLLSTILAILVLFNYAYGSGDPIGTRMDFDQLLTENGLKHPNFGISHKFKKY